MPAKTPIFLCEDINGQCKLKRTHAYFTQVQGQMGVSGASWCDFIFYTKKGISVERIPFDPAYWETLKLKLRTYTPNANMAEPLGRRPGRIMKVRLVRPRCVVLIMLPLKVLLRGRASLFYFAMPTSFCVLEY